LTFCQTSRLRPEARLISSNYTWKLCNTTSGSWKSHFPYVCYLFSSYKA